MFNISRESEFLGKSNGKKWSQIWTFLFENSLKSPLTKKFFSSLFTFEVPFNGLFAPISRSWMSNIFRNLESLGKSNEKKWSQILIFAKMAPNCCDKKSFFVHFFYLFTPFTSFLLPIPEVQCQTPSDFLNPWGKRMERRGLRSENICSSRGIFSN